MMKQTVFLPFRARIPEAALPISTLPSTLLDTLADWGTHCSAAGALARNLLQRNGIQKEPECDEGERPGANAAAIPSSFAAAQSLRLSPNPTAGELVIGLPPDVICAHLELVSLSDGISRLRLVPGPSNVFKIATNGLPNGAYVVLARLIDGSILRDKIIVLR